MSTPKELASKISRYHQAEFRLWNLATSYAVYGRWTLEGVMARRIADHACRVSGLIDALIKRLQEDAYGYRPLVGGTPCSHPELMCVGSCRAERACND